MRRAPRVGWPPGAYVVVVRAPGHAQEDWIERLYGGQRLARTYFIPKERLNVHETVVRAPPPRPETGVVSLQAEEIHNIPGTFGDPFRTALLLPGVGSIISGLGYPVIRGDSPGDNGTFIDEIKVPLLYHLGFGPAVIHPLYLESLDFMPGNFPAEFGRFTGRHDPGPHQRRAAGTRRRCCPSTCSSSRPSTVDPFKLGGRDAAVSAAARYGTFAFLAKAIDPRAVLSYWDYQVRADFEARERRSAAPLFGAEDRTGRLAGMNDDGQMVGDEILRLGFHRSGAALPRALATVPGRRRLRGRPRLHRLDGLSAAELRQRRAPDRAHRASPRGGDGGARHEAAAAVRGGSADPVLAREHRPTTSRASSRTRCSRAGPFRRASSCRPTGSRRHGSSSGRAFASTTTSSCSPAAGRSVRPASIPGSPRAFRCAPGVYVKGGVGIYQSPPRFIVPWPGLEGIGLSQGLNRSYQASLGAEVRLPWNATLDGQLYYNWMPNISEYPIGDESARPATHDSGQATYRGAPTASS